MDETTEATSTGTETTSTDAPSQPSESSEQPKASRSERANAAMNQLIRSGRGSRGGSVSQPADQDASQQTTDESPPASPTPKTLTLTEDELQRRIQAETDRREARRNREVQQQTAARTEAERLRLLRDDPIQGAEQEARRIVAEQEAAKLRTTVDAVWEQADRTVLDPLFQALPAKVQSEILAETNHLTGLESRMANAKAALKALEKHWKAEGAKDAEKSLRANPAFRKELLAEVRDDRDEPELIAGARPTHSTNMNDFILSRGGRNLPYRRVG